MRGSCGFCQAGVPEHRRSSRSLAARNHLISASPAHQVELHDRDVTEPPGLYTIRIKGRLGPTALSAFPTMVSELKGGETVLTGLLEDRSAVFGVLGQIEALGLELVELRHICPRPKSPESSDDPSPRGV